MQSYGCAVAFALHFKGYDLYHCKKIPGASGHTVDNSTLKTHYILAAFSLRLLLTTLTELSAIAAPAIIGSSRNPFTG